MTTDATSAIPAIPVPTTDATGSGAGIHLAPAECAGLLHSIFTDLEKAAHLLTDPAVIALLPGKYRAYALGIAAVEHAVEAGSGS